MTLISLKLLMSQHGNPIYCPVLSFLALAFADRAFEGISSPEELFATYKDAQPGFTRRVPVRKEQDV